ncbi:MAG TPA: CHAD domain-containing protein [Arenimonas sp.]
MPKAAKVRAASQGQALGGDLRAYALDQLAGATAQLGREGEDRHDGIHQARKSLRRARAALALARRELGDEGRRVDAALAAACRGMGALRDAQALIEALQRLAPKLPEELRHVLPESIALATARRDRMLVAALGRDPDFVRRRARLDAIAARLAKLEWDAVRGKDVARAVARSERRVAKARRRVKRNPGDDERWHVLRRRIRRLRQQDSLLQVVAPALKPAGGVPADQAVALGEAQDDALLLRHCARRSPFPPAMRQAIRKVARARLANVRDTGKQG